MHKWLVCCIAFLLSGCGFYLQGETQLASPLHTMYLQTPDPYGRLAKTLQSYLKMSQVTLVATPQEAQTILVIDKDDPSQELLSVSGTQQTRQYRIKVTVVFEITNASGVTILGPQTLTESRIVTVQSNQILGSSNEVNLYYQQMRRALAYAIMTRISSREVTDDVNAAFITKPSRSSNEKSTNH